MALISLSVETEELDSALDDLRSQIADIVSEQDNKLDHDGCQDVVREYLSDQDYVTQDGVENAVSLALDDILEERIDSDISNRNFLDESDVERIVDDRGYSTTDDVRDIVDEAINDHGYVDESDVERIVDDKLQATDLPNPERLADLERRLDRYAQKLDGLDGRVLVLSADVNTMSGDVLTLHEKAGKAITLFELLRRAMELLLQAVKA